MVWFQPFTVKLLKNEKYLKKFKLFGSSGKWIKILFCSTVIKNILDFKCCVKVYFYEPR